MDQNDQIKMCGICGGVYHILKHDFDKCFSLDIGWDLERMNFLEKYCEKLDDRICTIFNRTRKKNIPFDILDYGINTKCMEDALLIKQIQMKYGEIWQYVLGNYRHFHDLGIGHETGLDIISVHRKIIIELKNRHNTDNASSYKANFDKLAKFKKKNPNYNVIYGIVNDITVSGKICSVEHNGETIKKYTGMKLLKFIMGCDTEYIIKKTQHLVALYSPKV